MTISGPGRGALLALGLAACSGMAACSGHAGAVAAPSDSASPADVVAAYAAAMAQGDCAVADTLFPGRDATSRPCPDAGLATTRTGTVSAVDPKVWGKRPTDEVVDVMVTRTAHEGGVLGIGGSDVEHPWSYRLERASASQPWRIVDEGLG